MPATAALPLVRKGETLTLPALRDEARKAFAREEKRRGLTRTALAVEIRVSLPTVSRALTDATGRYASVQRRILAHLTGFVISEEPEYRVVERQAAGAGQ